MEPAEKSCAWGGPVITVNWFNMGMDGEKDGVLPLSPLHNLFDMIRCVIIALYQQKELM